MRRLLFTIGLAVAVLAYSPIDALARGGGGHGGHSYSSSGSSPASHRGSGYVNPSSHYTHGYFRSNGTYVPGYHATNPNGTKLDNYSTRGNINPWKGKPGTKSPN